MLEKKIKKIFSNIYFLYMLCFVLFFFWTFSPFFFEGKAFLWGSDGTSQNYPGLLYVKEWLSSITISLLEEKELEIPFWSLSLGLGQDIFGNAIDFRPLKLLYAFLAPLGMQNYLYIHVFLSMFFSGISFIVFARKQQYNDISILLSSLLYVFCGYTLYFSTRHTFFLEMMIYLPLLFIGVDDIYKKGISKLFILVVCIAGISYFYFLYIVTLQAVIYAIFKYFKYRKKDERNILNFIKTIGPFLWQYLLGILLSAFSFIPSYFRMIQSARSGNSIETNYIHWDWEYYTDFIKGIVDVEYIGGYGVVAISGLSLFAIVYLVVTRKNSNRILILGNLLVYVLALLIPGISMSFTAFTAKSQRWCFVLAFWAAIAVAEMLPLILKKQKKKSLFSFIVLNAFLFIYILISKDSDYGVESGGLWIIGFGIIIFLSNFTNVFKKRKMVLTMLLMFCMLLEITMKSYELFQEGHRNYMASYIDAGKIEEVGNDNAASAMNMIQDDSVYRVDVVTAPLSEKYYQMNYGLRNGLNGISSYYSFSVDNISDYSLGLGNSQQNVSFLILDFAQRTALNSLMGVKYLTTTDTSDYRVPYGYTLLNSKMKTFSDGHEEQIHLYQNEYALPLMYAYDSYITRDEYDSLTCYEKEQAMLQSIVLEEAVDYKEGQPKYDYEVLLDTEEILELFRKEKTDTSIVQVHEDHIIVPSKPITISIPLEEGLTGELYVYLDDILYNSQNYAGKEEWTPVSVSSLAVSLGKKGEKKDNVSLLNETYSYYMGERDALLNLGYCTTENKITFAFTSIGKYSFEDIQIVYQPMENYGEKIAALQDEAAEDIKIDCNTVSGTIEVEDDKFVYISIPFSTGWTAFVDGEETEILEANVMGMAVKVPKGKHTITLKYVTPGLMAGFWISLLTLVGIIIFVLIRFFLKKNLNLAEQIVRITGTKGKSSNA